MSFIPIEKVLHYLNEARTNPKMFATYVQQDIDSFVDDGHMPLMPGCLYSVNESKQTWVDCKSFLLSQPPLPPFQLSDSLNVTAKDHATDLAKNNIQGHVSSDGSTLTDRIERRCGKIQAGHWAENIGSDFQVEGRNNALKTVLGLIVDDGVANRGHRKNIFSKDYKYVGIHSKLQGDQVKTVMNFMSVNLPLLDKGAKVDPHQVGNTKLPIKNEFGGFQNDNHNKFGGMNMMNYKFPSNDDFFEKQNNFLPNNQNLGNQKGKYKVSTSTTKSSETKNGKTVVKITERIQYSDGSVEEKQMIQSN